MIKISTVCTGIGSPEQALKNLGIKHEIVFGCEIDKYAKQTYLANFTPNQMYEDMTKEQWDKPEQYADLFIGGIPCQSFSLAGKRLGELDPRGLLFFDFFRYVKNQKPKAFIIENVKGLLSDNNRKTFQNWLQLLGRSVNTQNMMFQHPDSLGYNLHWTVLNTKDFGLPQNRERVFLVGIRSDLPNTFRFPIGWTLEKRLKDILESEVDEKYYLSENAINSIILNDDNLQKHAINPDIANTLQSPGNACGVYKGANYILSNSGKSRQREIKEIVPPLRSHDGCCSDNFLVEPIAASIRGRYPDGTRNSINAGLPTQQTLEINDNPEITNVITTVQKDNVIIEQINNSETLTKYGNSQDMKISPLNGCSQTISSGHFNQPKILETVRIRRLTPLECFRLQGFPDEFVKPVSDTQLYKQAGNTISVPVIQGIIENLIPVLI